MSAISEKIVRDLPAPAEGNKLHYFSGARLQGRAAPSGFAVRVTSAGTKSFVWFHRVNGKQYLETIGRWDENAKGGGKYTVLQAIIATRARADEINRPGSVADVRPARTRTIEDGDKPEGDTVADMLDEYVARVEKDGELRGIDTIKSVFDRLVKPSLGRTGLYALRRSQVMNMLDAIADNNGQVMSDRTLSYFRKACNWRAKRDDDFTPPFVPGMSRTKPKDRARDRILDDGEICALWAALDQIPHPECYARYVRFLLHTGVRRNEASDMQWSEVNGDVWTIPGARTKNKADHAVPLTAVTHKLIGAKPTDIGKHPFVFSTTDGELAFASMSRMQRVLNKKLQGMPHWTLHDLRRTTRSLMSRAGVDPDIGERAIGHSIRGVRATYDRHKYTAEKLAAFQALDALLDRILDPTENVASITERRKQR